MKKDSKKKLAASYGQAMYQASAQGKDEELVFSDVKRLQQILSEDKNICKILATPLWDIEAKRAAISEIADKLKLNPVIIGCLNTAAENNRLNLLPEILEAFSKAYYVANNILQVKVSSAIKLSAQQDESLRKTIENKLNKKVEVSYDIKPEIMGGLMVEYDSLLIDDSIKGKLEKFKLLMKGTK